MSPLSLSLLAGGVTRIARRLAFGFQFQFAGCRLFLLACKVCGGFGCCHSFTLLLLGLLGLARLAGLGPQRGLRLALGLALFHGGIIGSRLGAKLVQDVLPGLLSGLLTV